LPKVCHFTTVHRPDDIRIFVKECRSLVAAGYEVVLIAVCDADTKVDGVQIRALRKPKGRIDRATRVLRDAYFACVREKADIYHFHDPELMLVGFWLKRLGMKVVYDVHENLPMDILHSKPYLPTWIRRGLSKVAKKLEDRAGARFDAIITVTDSFTSRFPKGKATVVQNYPILAEGPLPASEPRSGSTLLFTGGFATTRCAREIVDAMALLPDVELVVAGPCRSEALLTELQAKPAWDQVRFEGMLARNELDRLFAEATIGLVLNAPRPDYIEISTNKLFEYMLAGLPVIASAIPSWKSIVEEVGCGVIVDTTDAKEIARAVRELLDVPEEMKAMGERGRLAAQSRFHWGSEEEKLLAVYTNLLK
jgi:glycosyltransferase involved in cell wall biosynthesis